MDDNPRKRHEDENRQRDNDRLSSLPDEILIEIISRLPLRLAVTTGSLSRRWRCLWTNTTSINLTDIPKYFRSYDRVIPQIISPNIRTFTMDFRHRIGYSSARESSIYSWLCRISDCNIRKLKVSSPNNYDLLLMFHVTSSYFEMQSSLVSIELGSIFWFDLPTTARGTSTSTSSSPINLPNLRKLSLVFRPCGRMLLTKLIRGCSSLEELSLTSYVPDNPNRFYIIKCFNQNLRRLFIDIPKFERTRIKINAPKLEFLCIDAPKSTPFKFVETPTLLREAKIHFTAIPTLSTNNNSINKPIRSCSNSGKSGNRVLYSKYYGSIWHKLERIVIEVDSKRSMRRRKPLVRIVEYLLSNAIELKHFRFSVVGEDWGRRPRHVGVKERWELKLCKAIHECPMVSTRCEVEFVGRYFRTNRKDGPMAWKANGEVITFD